MPEVLSNPIELHDEDNWNGNNLSDVAEDRSHRKTLPGPVTQDRCHWFDEVVQEDDDRVERYSLFHDYDRQIPVQFPWSDEFKHMVRELQRDRTMAVFAEEQVSVRKHNSS